MAAQTRTQFLSSPFGTELLFVFGADTFLDYGDRLRLRLDR
jgi:hypothetical protein